MQSSVVLLAVAVCGYASARGFGDFFNGPGQMSGSLTSSVNGGPAKVIPLDSPEACPFCHMLQRTMCNGGMMMNSPICTKCGKNCNNNQGSGNSGSENNPWGGMGGRGNQHEGHGNQQEGHRHHGNDEEQQNGGFPSPSRGEESDGTESGPSQGFKKGGPQGGSPPANPSGPAPGR